jgi:hypothetical protein
MQHDDDGQQATRSLSLAVSQPAFSFRHVARTRFNTARNIVIHWRSIYSKTVYLF